MKRTYEQLLQDEGIADTRTTDIFEAMDAMHEALCKLDLHGRQVFWSTDFRTRLNIFAEIEQLSQL